MSRRLVLFLSFPRSLRWWDACGIKERELALYRRLVKQGYKVVILSYGDATEIQYLSPLDHNIQVLCNKWRLPQRLFSLLIPLIFSRHLRKADIFRTNQISGAYAAVWARLWIRKPLVVRQGYSLAHFWSRDKSFRRFLSPLCHLYEGAIQRSGDSLIVSTLALKKQAIENGCDGKDVYVIPNYVTDNFFDKQRKRQIARISGKIKAGFVGRLVEQKNLSTMINACAGLPISLEIVGDGNLKKTLRLDAERLGIEVRFLGTIPNDAISDLLETWHLFLFPTLYEGLPKALIEAMASGTPILATKVPEITSIVTDDETCILVEPTVRGLTEGLQKFLRMTPSQREAMGEKASTRAAELYSLHQVVNREAMTHQVVISRTT